MAIAWQEFRGCKILDLRELFQNYIDKKIVLYGLGTETEKVLGELDSDFTIAGLLDSFQESGELYGKPILSLQQAVHMQVKLIIVVARPGSCKAIAKRIKGVCVEQGMDLFDIRGKNLLVLNQVLYDFGHVDGGTKEELLKKAAWADTVSFDLFDTLVTRKVLSYTDLFEWIEYRLQDQGYTIPDFPGRRLQAEKELAKSGAPTLEMIYEFLLDHLENRVDISASELAELEWETDVSFIIPRGAVVEVFQQIVQSGKKVYIVTDTYYRRPQLDKLLERCGVKGYADLLASCEYQTGKRQELFPVFRKLCGTGKIFHVGDDLVADMEAAQKCGIETFRIYSGLDLLDELGSLGMEEYTDCLTDRMKLGLFTARLLNDPFQFEGRERTLKLTDAYDVGYTLCAPMICDFVLWFHDRVRKKGLCNVWFPSRDGYLLKKLYRIIDDTETVYFLTSRIAAIRAGMENLSDVRYADSMKFSGTLEENLQVRFGISADKVDSVNEKETGLMRYTEAILKHAKKQRSCYGRYLDTLCLRKGGIAFFDFVAKGTTQLFVQKLMKKRLWKNCPLQGFYFLQLEPDFMADKELEIESFYRMSETKESAVFDNYYILETILTAPHPMVTGFDEEGEPIYGEETRSEQDIRCIMRAQDGIKDYFQDYLRMLPGEFRTVDRTLDEMLLGLIHHIRIMDKEFLALVVEDPFFNRMTWISDVLL